jgi:peptidyl-prolyl cis-trans isomerase A (cyclophilin A)
LRTRPQLEVLESRWVPAANASGTVSGLAFIDHIGNGVFDPSDVVLPGIVITLTGTTTTGSAVQTSATTDANGSFQFQNVLPGTYQVSSGSVPGLLGPSNQITISSDLAGGQTITQNLSFLGLAPGAISQRMFLSSTTAADFPETASPAGSGTTPVNVRPNNSPIVTALISDVSVAKNSAGSLTDLAANFSDPDITNSTLTFHTNQGDFNVELFDTTAPQTVANFLDYVNSGAFNNAIFTRLVSGFVLQGGGATLQVSSSGSSLQAVPALAPVPNEFSAPNTAGTLAMALTAGNPNSGTNQFFFNLVDNSTQLDPQKFTVFGKLASSADASFLASLAQTPTQNQSFTATAAALPAVDLQNVPLINYTGTNFPTDATASNFLVINSLSVQRTESLTYSVVGNTNPGLVTPTVKNERLSLAYTPNQTGSAIITVRATDQFGAFVDSSFTVTVHP